MNVKEYKHPIRMGRPRRIRYTYLYILLFFLGILLVLSMFLRIFQEQKKEQEPVVLMVESPSGTVPNELFLRMQDFAGLLHCRAVYAAQAEIKIGNYQTNTEIWGVSLSDWPLKITKSAGKKHLGTMPLLVAGEEFFQGLTDEYGAGITRRQARIFVEKIGTLDVEVSFSSTSEIPSSRAGSFLALTEGERLYMDAAQMRELLESSHIFSGISRVCLEIKGESAAEKAEKSLTKAGFLVEKDSPRLK